MSYAYARDDSPWSQNTAVTIDAAIPDRVAVNKPALARESSNEIPAWARALQKRLEELVSLPPDWDGRGSAAVRMDALAFAWSVLGQSMAPSIAAPSMVPLGDGGVLLAWTSGAADIEVEVAKPNHVMIYHVDHRTGAEREWQTATEFSGLASLLRSTFAR
jgi:hypothetical protein